MRALGQGGHQVGVAASRRPSLAGVSRFAASTHLVPDPCDQPVAFGESMIALTHDFKPDVVLPVTEAATLAILPQRTRLDGAIVPVPDLEVFRAVSDKEHVLRVASDLGIAVPDQWVASTREMAAALQVPPDRFPIVVKPSRSVVEGHGGRLKLRVQYAESAADLQRVLRDLPPAAYPVLLQRQIVGEGVGIFMLIWDGDVWARFAHRRIREKPPSGGVSVCRESIPLPQPLFAQSWALLESLGWFGVAMVEYKIDHLTGTAYLMEINGRLWGSLQLAIDAGVDFPSLLVALAVGERPAAVTTYAYARTRWWWGDVDHLIGTLTERRGPASSAPGKLRTAVSVLSPFRRGEQEEVFRWRDPMPFLVETCDWIRRR